MPEDPWLKEHIDDLYEKLMTSLQKHLERRGDENEVDKNGKHIDIIRLISIVSHPSEQALTEIPIDYISNSRLLLWVGDSNSTEFDYRSNVISLFAANVDQRLIELFLEACSK
jgi:hypothetical protein